MIFIPLYQVLHRPVPLSAVASLFLAGVVPLVSLFAPGACAQSDIAQCKDGYEWNRNSLDQDPCTIGSILDASCRGIEVYNYPPLNNTEYYIRPMGDDPSSLKCDCNTVMYNLYMACTSCQGGEIYSWSTWMDGCKTVQFTQYPCHIPQGTTVPRWAFYDTSFSSNQTYSDFTTEGIGRDPEELPQGNTTDAYSSSSPPEQTTLSPSSTRSSTSQLSPTGVSSTKVVANVGFIAGGVAGSVVSLVIISVVGYFYMRHRRHQRAKQQLQNAGGKRPPLVCGSLTLYNPSDPSTFPRNLSILVKHTGPLHNARGAYSGVAEV